MFGEVASAISALGFCVPLLVGSDNEIIHGEVSYEAAKQLGLDSRQEQVEHG